MKTVIILIFLCINMTRVNAQNKFNLDFEYWKFDSISQYYFPESWSGWGIMKNSNSISGNYSISVTGMSGCGFMPGELSLGNNVKPGLPISEKPSQLNGLYQYNKEDSATAIVLLRKFNTFNNSRDTIGKGFIRLGKTSGYDFFSIHILDLQPSLMPDTIEINFVTGFPDWKDTIFVEPTLQLDNLGLSLSNTDCNLISVTDLQLKSDTLYVSIFVDNSTSLFAYPFISFITDKNGETITSNRSSSLPQYQHPGNTTQTYPISTTLSSLPSNYSCDVFFGFTDNWWSGYTPPKICVLPYQSTQTVIEESKEFSNLIEIFPNPFSSFATIQIPNEKQNTNYEFMIFDLLGRTVHHQTLHSNYEILNANLPTGIYFYQLKNKNEIVATGKMVIQ